MSTESSPPIRKVETITASKKAKERLRHYLQDFCLESFELASTETLTKVFLVACNDFFSQDITVASFSAIADTLLPHVQKKATAPLSGAVCLAADLNCYKKNDLSGYFLWLKEIMHFYLDEKVT